MRKESIKILIEQSPLLVTYPQAEKVLTDNITEAFIKTGLHRRLDDAKFKQEIKATCGMLLRDIQNDDAYSTLRVREINYCFSNGLKGRLGIDRDIDLTYKSLVRWIEAYVRSSERRAALEEYLVEQTPKVAIPERIDYDAKGSVVNAYVEFCDYKSRLEQARMQGEIQDVGSLALPMSCIDYGYVKMRYLKEKGADFGFEKLKELFEEKYKVHKEAFIGFLKNLV